LPKYIVHLQFVCPGTWLCDLTLERYEVREKKVSKKVGGLWNVNIYQFQTLGGIRSVNWHLNWFCSAPGDWKLCTT